MNAFPSQIAEDEQESFCASPHDTKPHSCQKCVSEEGGVGVITCCNKNGKSRGYCEKNSRPLTPSITARPLNEDDADADAAAVVARLLMLVVLLVVVEEEDEEEDAVEEEDERASAAASLSSRVLWSDTCATASTAPLPPLLLTETGTRKQASVTIRMTESHERVLNGFACAGVMYESKNPRAKKNPTHLCRPRTARCTIAE